MAALSNRRRDLPPHPPGGRHRRRRGHRVPAPPRGRAGRRARRRAGVRGRAVRGGRRGHARQRGQAGRRAARGSGVRARRHAVRGRLLARHLPGAPRRAAALSAGPVPARPRPRRVPRDRAARRSWPPDRPHRRGRAPDAVPTPPRPSCRRCGSSPPGPRPSSSASTRSWRSWRPPTRSACRIGRDLHDGAQQRLVVLGHALDLALRELEADPSRAARLLSSAREQAAAAGRELRELAQGLHPVRLDRGLAHALSALAGSSPLPVHLDAVPDGAPARRGRGHGLVPRLRGALERDQVRRRQRAAGRDHAWRATRCTSGSAMTAGRRLPFARDRASGPGRAGRDARRHAEREQPAGAHGHDAHGSSAPAALISGSIR